MNGGRPREERHIPTITMQLRKASPLKGASYMESDAHGWGWRDSVKTK